MDVDKIMRLARRNGVEKLNLSIRKQGENCDVTAGSKHAGRKNRPSHRSGKTFAC